LDAILEGGLCEGTLTELVGASATGKTQVSRYMKPIRLLSYKAMCFITFLPEGYSDPCWLRSSSQIMFAFAVSENIDPSHIG
jgi:hypothetical protein